MATEVVTSKRLERQHSFADTGIDSLITLPRSLHEAYIYYTESFLTQIYFFILALASVYSDLSSVDTKDLSVIESRLTVVLRRRYY